VKHEHGSESGHCHGRVTGDRRGTCEIVQGAELPRRRQFAVDPPSDDPGILTIAGDISLPETAKRVAEEALGRFGRIDSLVNNAGIFIGKRFTDYTETDFRNMLAVNLAGFFHVTQASIPVMERQGAGHVVNITTSLVDHPLSSGPSALASLTKGGLNAVTKALAIEYARRTRKRGRARRYQDTDAFAGKL